MATPITADLDSAGRELFNYKLSTPSFGVREGGGKGLTSVSLFIEWMRNVASQMPPSPSPAAPVSIGASAPCVLLPFSHPSP